MGTSPEEYSPFVQSILEGFLAPSTQRLYRYVLQDIQKNCEIFDPLSEEMWMRWIQRKLQSTSPISVAGYIKSAQAALVIKGVDLSVKNPQLNNLLNKLSSRLRSFGNREAKSRKNTDQDRKPVVTLDEIKRAFVSELRSDSPTIDWVTQLNSIRNEHDIIALNIPRDLLTSFVLNIVSLLGGLRKSDVSKTCISKIEHQALELKVVNWKLSNPAIKRKKPILETDLKDMRSRAIQVRRIESPDSPYNWILALARTNPRQGLNRFLFQSKGRGARSSAWSDLTVELKLRRIPLKHNYTHRFRVSHASLVRAAGFSDDLIMKQVDWAHPSLIDRYERYLPKKKYIRDYIVGLGFGGGFK